VHLYGPDDDVIARELADACVRRLALEAPLDYPMTPAQLREAAGQTITRTGLGGQATLRLWDEVLAPTCLSVDNPRYLSFIPSAPTRAAAAFDMLVGASSVYAGSWLEGSGAVYAENQALRWIADLCGLPAGAGGVFVQGGSGGNLSALVAAREHARTSGRTPTRWSVCVTGETHSSVKHALRVVMDVDVVEVPGDDRGRMVGSALRSTVEGLDPLVAQGIFAVVATAGSTNLGVVDDIAGIAEVCQERGWWLHVDGAYGGAGLAAPSVRHLFDGIEHADSFIVDPHKWLFAPFDSCALLYRDPELGRAAHTQHADYLDPVTVEGEWNPSVFAIQLTRRARGLPFWFSLAMHGTDSYRAAVEQTLAVTRHAADLVRRADHVRLLVEPELSVVVFERVGWSAQEYADWSAQLLKDQIAFVTPTKHRGQVCTRFAIVNPLTTVEDIATILDTMR
jgi:L-2,4-diaminobutyrate decarboxylase